MVHKVVSQTLLQETTQPLTNIFKRSPLFTFESLRSCIHITLPAIAGFKTFQQELNPERVFAPGQSPDGFTPGILKWILQAFS